MKEDHDAAIYILEKVELAVRRARQSLPLVEENRSVWVAFDTLANELHILISC